MEHLECRILSGYFYFNATATGASDGPGQTSWPQTLTLTLISPRDPSPSIALEEPSSCPGDLGFLGLFVGLQRWRWEDRGNDVELVCKTLQFEHKLFYFDLKENPRGRYLKISEKTSATRSTIIVPVNGIVWFLDLFNYYINTDERDAFSKELKLDTKVFYFDIGENKRGRFLKVSEASANRNRSTIIVPAGSSGEEGWAAFRNIYWK
uniref:Transcription factor Pur-alpha 1 n=1 Tax=Ananas comosus var. bracteatus TaxID=296719 RepID=A0A6V7NFQ2_ANACO|nr:unnamed protein product [Ananas comosus var. bracteatus]